MARKKAASDTEAPDAAAAEGEADAPAGGPESGDFPDDATISAGDSNMVRMRWENPAEEKISGGIAVGEAVYPKREDGSYVVRREHVGDLRRHGLRVEA